MNIGYKEGGGGEWSREKQLVSNKSKYHKYNNYERRIFSRQVTSQQMTMKLCQIKVYETTELEVGRILSSQVSYR